MYNLPYQFEGLGVKRQKQIYDFRMAERQDAALNAVVIGLKCLNQVHGIGFQRLIPLSTEWVQAINDFYKSGGILFGLYRSEYATFAGEIATDGMKLFYDLSERRQREIRNWIIDDRKEAQWNAAGIGCDVIRKRFGFGEKRMRELQRQWENDIENFYRERDIYEPRLKAWIEEIGFIFEDGRLRTYKTVDGQNVKKGIAEKWLAEDIVDRGDM